jgi:hypothetical protein
MLRVILAVFECFWLILCEILTKMWREKAIQNLKGKIPLVPWGKNSKNIGNQANFLL